MGDGGAAATVETGPCPRGSHTLHSLHQFLSYKTISQSRVHRGSTLSSFLGHSELGPGLR